MRQFHFQNVVGHLPDVMHAKDDKKKQDALLKQIGQQFEAFRNRMQNHLDAEFSAVVKEEETSDENWNLFPFNAKQIVGDSTPHANQMLEAYRNLRVMHQINYARHVLRDPKSLTDFPCLKQEKWLSAVGVTCIGGVFALHMAFAWLNIAGHAEGMGPLAHVAVLWLAIGALTAKAFEEALNPQREVERYKNYHNSLQIILERFDSAESLSERVSAMSDLERLSYQETKLFLRTNVRAKFLI